MLNPKFYCKTMNLKITLFSRIDWTTYGLKTISFDDAIQIIRDGTLIIDDTNRSGMSGTLRDITEKIQALPPDANIQAVKQQFLPAVSFNGVYSNGIIQYSSITALDFDHIPNQDAYTELCLRLAATPCVLGIYRTPSGKGLKALILHDNTDPSMHSNLYEQLLLMFYVPYIKTDSSCKDLSRRNYLCYDPIVWSNSNPVPFHFVYDASISSSAQSKASYSPKQVKGSTFNRVKPVIAMGLPSDASVMNLLKSKCRRFHPEYLCEGARRDGCYWFGTQSSRAGVDYDYALDFVLDLYNSSEIQLTRGGVFTEDEAKVNFTNGYNTEIYDEDYRNSFIIKK